MKNLARVIFAQRLKIEQLEAKLDGGNAIFESETLHNFLSGLLQLKLSAEPKQEKNDIYPAGN
jgi:hypothetical protein